MFVICAPGGFFPEVSDILPPSHFQILEDWTPESRSRSVAWLIRAPHAVDPQILEQAPLLRLIVMQGTGLDHVNLAACSARKITVLNTPGVNANAAAEWTLLLLLSLHRKFLLALEGIKGPKWKREEWMGSELSGKILGLIGLGNVGRNVAKKAQAFGMRVKAFDPYVETDVFNRLGVESVARDEVFRSAGVVSLHLPLSPETRGSVGQREFELMKSDAFLVNTARGEILDEAALLKALDQKLAGAGLDVFSEEPLSLNHPFLHHPKIICSPHMAGQSHGARLEIQKQACEKVLEFFNLKKGK